MNRKKTKWPFLSVTFFGILVLNSALFCQNIQIPTEKEFDVIYESLFPKKSLRFDAVAQEYAMDIRVQPSFGSPSQLSVVKTHDGRFELSRYDLVDRKKDLFEQLISLPEYKHNKTMCR